MNTFEPINSDRLRDKDLMIAYLRDRADRKDEELIEQLMEDDPLYRLSMETLAEAMSENPANFRSELSLVEARMEQMLLSGRDQLIKRLESSEDQVSGAGLIEKFRKLPGWQKYLGLFFVIILWAGLIYIPLSHSAMPSEPELNLVPAGDIALAKEFLAGCGEKSPQGFGRADEPVSVYSALMLNYVEGNYQTALDQFQQVKKAGGLSASCEAMTIFYEAKSLMAIGRNDEAKARFTEAVQHPEIPVSARNAGFWYLANMEMAAGNEENAGKYFAALLASDKENKADHLATLMEKKYLQQAEQFLEYLK